MALRAPLQIGLNLPERTIANVFQQLLSVEKQPIFNTEQIKKLTDLKLTNGENIFTLNLDGRGLAYSMITQFQKYGYDTVYDFLKNKTWNNRDQILLESPMMEKTREGVRLENELYRNKNEIEKGDVKCPKCSSTEVLIGESQTRSADEPMTLFFKCVACNHPWKG